MQEVVTYIVLAAAVGYAMWHVVRSFRKDSKPCCGCEGCPLKGPQCQDKCGEKC